MIRQESLINKLQSASEKLLNNPNPQKVMESGNASANSPSIVFCAPYVNDNWKWFTHVIGEDGIRWYFFHDKPRGLLEKYIKRPNLSRIRACLEAILFAKKHNVKLIVSHEARFAFWCAFFAKWLGVQIEHISSSFNFTELPQGLKRTIMASAYTNVSQFIVHTKGEEQLYSDYFDIPIERFKTILWSDACHEVSPEEPLELGDYIGALGSNMRDYRSLMEAMEKLPDIKLILVASPDSLKNLRIPSNVKVISGIPYPHAMNILKYSRFMVLPLQGSEIRCGHVTLVAAMYLGKAFIATKSSGIADYVLDNYNAIACEPFAPDALAEAIRALWDDPEKCQQIGENGRQFAEKYCAVDIAVQHWRHLLYEQKILSN